MKFKYYFFIISLFSTELISNFGAVDKIGPQWLYLSLLNLIIFLYFFIYEKVLEIDVVFKNKTTISYILFLIMCLISISVAQNKIESINYFSRLVIVFFTFINFSLLLRKINKKAIFWILSIVLFIEGLAIFGQFLELYDFGKDFGRNSKLIGVSANINIAGFSIALILPFTLSLLNQLTGIKKIFFFSFTTISIFSSFLTGSRGTALSVTIIFIGFSIYHLIKEKGLYLKVKKIGFILLPFFLSIITTELLFNSMRYSYRMNQIVERGSNSRLKYYKDAFESIKENPIIGIGIGNWKINSIDKGKRHIEGYIVPYHAHNDYIQILAEVGFLGLISYLCIIWFALKKHLLMFFKSNSQLIFSCLLFFLVYALDSNLNFPIARPIMQIKLAFILAILLNHEE